VSVKLVSRWKVKVGVGQRSRPVRPYLRAVLIASIPS
jgi:hypothetical protein